MDDDLTVEIRTQNRESMTDITATIQKCINELDKKPEALFLFCPDTGYCTLTINKSADPEVHKDIESLLADAIPSYNIDKKNWLYDDGSNHATMKSVLIGASLLVPLDKNGKLKLEPWQAIYLYDGEGPSTRPIWVSLLDEVS